MNSASTILLVFLIGLSGCRTKLVEPYAPTTVEVTVVDSQTGVPVPHAIVSVVEYDSNKSNLLGTSPYVSVFNGNTDTNGKMSAILRIAKGNSAEVSVTPDGRITPVSPVITPRVYGLTYGTVNKVVFRFKF
jgi:hypothetical protein